MDRDSEDFARYIEQLKRTSPFLDTRQAAFIARFSKSGFEKMRDRGVGPEFRYHGRKVVYHIKDVMDWSDARRRKNGAGNSSTAA